MKRRGRPRDLWTPPSKGAVRKRWKRIADRNAKNGFIEIDGEFLMTLGWRTNRRKWEKIHAEMVSFAKEINDEIARRSREIDKLEEGLKQYVRDALAYPEADEFASPEADEFAEK
jgi:hypothetical protein